MSSKIRSDEYMELLNALRPFAEAADNLEEETRDGSEIWELPAAMSITAGDLRTAKQVWDSFKK